MDQDRRILTHEARPGYRAAFYAAVLAALVYLALVFLGAFAH